MLLLGAWAVTGLSTGSAQPAANDRATADVADEEEEIPEEAAPERIAVDNVVGMNGADAAEALGEQGLRVERAEERASDATPFSVVGQNPQPGTDVEPGAAVELTIAIPPAPQPDAGSSQEPGQTSAPLCDDPARVSQMIRTVRQAINSSVSRDLHIERIEEDLMVLHRRAEVAGETGVTRLIVDAVDALDAPDVDSLQWLRQPLDVAEAIVDVCIGTPAEREAERQQQREEFLEGTGGR